MKILHSPLFMVIGKRKCSFPYLIVENCAKYPEHAFICLP